MYYNAFSVKDYIRRMEAGESPVTACRRFSKLERMRYTLLLSLLTGSIGITEFKQKAGRHCWLYLSIDLLGLMLLGALVIRDGQLVLTRRGRYYWVILMGTLFAVVGDYREAYAKELD